MYYTRYTLNLCCLQPRLPLLFSFWPTYRRFPRGGVSTKDRQETGGGNEKNKTHHSSQMLL